MIGFGQECNYNVDKVNINNNTFSFSSDRDAEAALDRIITFYNLRLTDLANKVEKRIIIE